MMRRRARTTWCATVILAMLAGCGGSTAPSGSASPSSGAAAGPFKVVGYITPSARLASIDFAQLTHINYAFLIPRANGTTRPFGAPKHLQAVVAQAKEHGVKVLIALGGWGWDREFEALAVDPSARSALARRLADFCAAYRLDGVDIDWEYPNAGPSAEGFAQLVAAIRAALPRGALVTAAVIADSADAAGIGDKAIAQLDFLNLMAYDGPTGDHSSFAMAEGAVASWRARGVAASKLVLGLPFYGRPGSASYRALLAGDPAAARGDRVVVDGVEVNYNGPATIRRKTELALQVAGGVMIWELSQDASGAASLLRVIGETVASP